MPKYQMTLYIDQDIKDELDTYCYMATKNRIRVINTAIKEYLDQKLIEESLSRGIIK